MAGRSRHKSDGARRRGGNGELPGEHAKAPTEVPARGWWQILKRAWRDAKRDHLPLMAAGVAFFGLLALFPALIATMMIYGLVTDPAQVQGQIQSYASALPSTAQDVVRQAAQNAAQQAPGALSFGAVISILIALWSASSGIAGLIKATNVAYDEDETRGFVKLRGTALLMTLGAIVFVLVALALVAVLPVALEAIGLGGIAAFAIQAARWVGLVAAVIIALAVVYRFAPDRDAPRFQWVSPGAIVGALLWIVASVAFSLYMSAMGQGSYAQTYGAFAGIIILMLWLFLSAYAALLGAEINAEAEHQTRRDTTVGRAEPMGERRAVKADTVPQHP